MESGESLKEEMPTLLEMKQVQNQMSQIKQRLMSANQLGTYFAGEAVQVLLKTKEICQEAISCIENSVLTVTEFKDLPHLPVKLIFSYLDIEDKQNLRLVSKTSKRLIDDLDSQFQVWKFDLSQDRLPDEFEFFVESDKDVSVTISDGDITADVINFVNTFSHRIVHIKAPSQAYSQIQSKEFSKVKQIEIFSTTGFCGAELPAEISTYFRNLKILNLSNVKLQLVENLEFQVLQYLNLHNVKDLGGLAPLLAASAQTLESLDMLNVYDPDFSDLSVKMSKLFWIGFNKCGGIKGFFNLALLSSSSLKELHVMDSVSDEEIPCGKMYCLPELFSLKICETSETFTNLLTWKLPKLVVIQWADNPMRHLEENELELSTVRCIVLFEHEPNILEENLNVLLSRCWIGLESLHIHASNNKTSKEFQISQKPQSLKTLFLLGADKHFQAEMIKQAPNLEHVHVSKYGTRVLSNSKAAIKNISIHQFKFEKYSFGFEELSRYNLVQLSIVYCDELEIPAIECLLRLKILHLDCRILLGLENLLSACSSSLEELRLAGRPATETRVTLRCMNFEMKSLKTINVDMNVDLGQFGLQFLLRSCSGVLEKLTFPLPYHEIKEVFPENLFLPQLKILQTYPKPSFYALSEITKHIPESVVLWFF